jgi:hypothetical protein
VLQGHARVMLLPHNQRNPALNRYCMYKDETTEIAATGLRYTAKEGGSPFQGMGSNGDVRSCMQCGQHRLRSKGAIHRFLGGLMFFCYECRPKKLPQ